MTISNFKLTKRQHDLLNLIAYKNKPSQSMALGSDLLSSFSANTLTKVMEEGFVSCIDCAGDTRYWLTDKGKIALKQTKTLKAI